MIEVRGVRRKLDVIYKAFHYILRSRPYIESPRRLISLRDEDGGGDPESLRQAADLSNVEFAFAGKDF
jgi:hypothetical protein